MIVIVIVSPATNLNLNTSLQTDRDSVSCVRTQQSVLSMGKASLPAYKSSCHFVSLGSCKRPELQ
jgi:hypothetical protein